MHIYSSQGLEIYGTNIIQAKKALETKNYQSQEKRAQKEKRFKKSIKKTKVLRFSQEEGGILVQYFHFFPCFLKT